MGISCGPRFAGANLADHTQNRFGVHIFRSNRETIPRDPWKWGLVAIRNQSDCQSATKSIDKIAVAASLIRLA